MLDQWERGGWFVSSKLHLIKGSNIYNVWHEWTDLKEDSGHGGQRVRQTNWSQMQGGSPCAPTPGEGQSLVSYNGWLPSPGYHNGNWTIEARYGWRTFTPPYQIGDPQYAEVNITVNFNNLLLQPDLTNPVVLIWDPDDPTKRQTRGKMELTDAQRANGEVWLRVYHLDDPTTDRQPFKTVKTPVTTPVQLVEIEWDGTDDYGSVMEAGVYAYDLLAWDTVSESGGDVDIKSSNYLFIDPALDNENNPITETELIGPDSTGNLLYYRKQHRLREVQVPLDNDGDGWENEDPVNGVDDDGDGGVDEDPTDYQPLGNASGGKITLYDPDLQKVAEWSISALWCEYN